MRRAVDAWLPQLREQAKQPGGASPSGGAMGVAVDVVDVMRTDDRRASLS
jgi:hypothetical protein